MKNKIKKLCCILLSIATIMCMMPQMAFAGSGSGTDVAPSFTSLVFGSEGGAKVFSMTPEFSSSVDTYTVTVPDYQDTLYMDSVTDSNNHVSTLIKGYDSSQESTGIIVSPWNFLWHFIRPNSCEGNSGKVIVNNSDKSASKTYNIAVVRKATLKSLSVNDSMSPSFDPDVTSYMEAEGQSIPCLRAI